jgi:hypothetical protein
MKIELSVNPIRITVPEFGRVEYVKYTNGRRRIYAVKEWDRTGPVGIMTPRGYKPRGEITFESPENISRKDEQLREISSELARRHKFRSRKFSRSQFRNAMPYLMNFIPPLTATTYEDTKNQLKKARGLVEYYFCRWGQKVNFGPLFRIYTKMERMNDVRNFVDEFKPLVGYLYGESHVFQTREGGVLVMREL